MSPSRACGEWPTLLEKARATADLGVDAGKTMELTFEDARWEYGRALPRPHDVVVGVEAAFAMRARDGRLLYAETDFTIVELALDAERWMSRGLPAGEDFVFTSVDSEDVGLVRCLNTGAGWQFGAFHQEFDDPNLHGDAEVRAIFAAFMGAVDDWLQANAGRTLAETGANYWAP